MSNIIPPLLSNTPPPPPSPEDDDDDEFGDFTGANDLSYGCDTLSLPPSPDHSPKNVSISNRLDINSNSEKNKVVVDLRIDKDFQDKRKSSESFNHLCNLDENYIESVDENILQYSKDIVTDIPQMQDKISEDTSEADLKSHCNLSDDKATEHQQDLNNENEPCSNQQILENKINNDIEKIEDEFSPNVKAKPLNFTIDSDLKKETFSHPSNDLESTMNLEQKDLDDNIKVEMHPCELNTETYSCEGLAESKEFNSNIFTQAPFTEPRDLNLTEKEEKNCETSHDGLANWSTFETNVNVNEIVNMEHISTDDEFADFESADVERQNSEEVSYCIKNIENELSTAIDNNISRESICAKLVQNENNGVESTVDPSIESSVETKKSDPVTEKIIETLDEDDFDDFCEFTSNTSVQNSKQDELRFPSKQESDDFGNFANFPEVVEEPVFLLLNEKQAMEKCDTILKEIFPASSIIEEDFCYADVESTDFIFNELKDITDTNALTYVWSNSASQNMLLKALNIDARNILYGASWNPSMPRFAANLGLTPLEPIKTEIPPCAQKSSPSTSSQPSSSDIPSAQFDWNGSGLVNPLDYSQTTLLDLEQLVASLDIPTCNASSNSNHSSPTNELNEWDIWLQSIPKKSTEMSQANGAKKSFELPSESSILQPQIVAASVTSQRVPSKNDLEEDVISPNQNADDFDDFASYQPSTATDTWPNIVPLRETYISNDTKELPLDITNWLQPTIVTPELPRKDLEIGDEELPNIQTPEFTRKEVTLGENDDDFDDFQMVLPEPVTDKKNNTDVNNAMSSDFLQPMQPNYKEPTVPPNLNLNSIDFTNISFSEEKSKVEPVMNFVSDVSHNKASLEINVVKEKEPITIDDEDDFTEFHCSVPAPQPIAPKPLTPILEPLKPTPLYAAISTTPSTQINWPDPGITDEEIKKFEMVFKRPQEYSNGESKKEELEKNIEQPKKVSKDNSLDDDEWSDFVSVQKPSPVHKFQLSEKERTSSPDLPLSVLNLGNIQPAKQPIPVITPHGLIQTKLSSSNSLNLSPKVQLKNNIINTQQKTVYQKPQIHPSIISSQFASQAYNFNSGNLNQNKAVLNSPLSQPQSTNSNLQSLDDDDWSDFISSPLPPTTSNGYQQNWQNTSTYKQSNWTNASPNIIANPRHFIQSGSDMKNRKVSNISVNSKKSTIPSISLPELEFIAPKERTSSSRKK